MSTETLSTLTLVMVKDPELVAYEETDEASAPEETAEFTELATLPSVSPPSSARLSVGTVTSTEIVAESVRRRPRVARRDPSLHT